MLPPGNTLFDLFVYADEKWAHMPDESEKLAMKHLLAEDLFGIEKTQRRNPETIRLSESQLLTWMRAVKRIASNEPLQYVTGKASFYGFMFEVNPSVLIPRPETEELVELILNSFPADKALRVIDFCTGSGCIPVTLKKKRPNWEITATDISAEALKTARKNADNHQADIHFFEGDLLSENGVPEGSWDILISNPPYVAQHEEAQMAPHVLQYEPHIALFVPDDDAVRFYRRISEIAQERLQKQGRLFLELNPLYAEECAELFKKNNWATTLHTDLSGKMRFLEVSNAL